MRLEARVYQAALRSYGFEGEHGEPIALDGVIGPVTRYAAARFDEWVSTSAGGEIWGDYTITPAEDGSGVDVEPDAVARRLQHAGAQFMVEHPELVIFPRDRTRRASSSSAVEAPPAPVALAQPFFRWSNPFVWLLAALGFSSLGGLAFWFGRRMRSRRA